MWTLTGFADEIGPDLEEQLQTLEAESIRFLELRSVWSTNVSELSDVQLDNIHRRLQRAGVSVSAIGSPIGKVPVETPIQVESERMRRIANLATRLGTRLVRVFSFRLPPGRPHSEYRQEVMDRMGALTRVAEAHQVILAHENEAGLYGDRPEACHDLLAGIDSPYFRATFDAANFVQSGVHPHSEAYELLRPYLVYVQVKDAIAETGQVVPAGEGDAEIRSTLVALHDSDFDGFFSLEPHLPINGQFRGVCGPAGFQTASKALKALFEELSIPYQ